MWETPLAACLDLPGNGARKRVACDGKAHVRWEPQEEGVMRTAASFPSVRNQGLSNQQESRSTLKVDGGEMQCGATPGIPAPTWNLHNTIKILCPNLTVRLSISPACCKQRIKRMVWRMMFACKEQQRTMIAVGCISDVKEWTGVHSSLVVSLQ